MAKKKEFTPELQRHMRSADMDYRYFELVNDFTQSMLVKDKRTGQVVLVRKGQNPKRLGN